jgi:imidazolonepropionase-like amidohydrolase
MSVLKFSGPVLPDGEVRHLCVVDGHITYERHPEGEKVVDGWIVPGLVDAHCHLGLDDDGAVSEEEAEAQAIADRDAGALLIRDCGSALDTSWMHEREDLPHLIRAGRHIARTRRYIRNYAHEVEPEAGSSSSVTGSHVRTVTWPRPSPPRRSPPPSPRPTRRGPGSRPTASGRASCRVSSMHGSTASSTAPGSRPTWSRRWWPITSRWCRR